MGNQTIVDVSFGVSCYIEDQEVGLHALNKAD